MKINFQAIQEASQPWPQGVLSSMRYHDKTIDQAFYGWIGMSRFIVTTHVGHPFLHCSLNRTDGWPSATDISRFVKLMGLDHTPNMKRSSNERQNTIHFDMK